MSKTLCVIVFSPNQRSTRAVIVPSATDDPNTWDSVKVPMHLANIQPGEQAISVPLAEYLQYGHNVTLARRFSIPSSNTRCVVVNAFGIVIAIVPMDPKLDSDPRGILYHDPLGLVTIGQSIIGLGLTQ